MSDSINEAATLNLDEHSLEVDELSIPALTHEIGLKKKPNWILVKMMNALEKKRQGKGYGWSRAWNKYGLNVYRTHICNVEKDSDYLAPAQTFLKNFVQDAPENYRQFIEDLFQDPTRMSFTFYHNNDSDERQYEGLTMSFGRKVPEDKTKRDRLDIILEDRRQDGTVDGEVDRIRIYLCPWNTYQDKNFHLIDISDLSPDQQAIAQDLYKHCIDYYHQWKGEQERQWSHWSVRFIEYFGPRSFIPKGSSFT
jgi:hypothetical protein